MEYNGNIINNVNAFAKEKVCWIPIKIKYVILFYQLSKEPHHCHKTLYLQKLEEDTIT